MGGSCFYNFNRNYRRFPVWNFRRQKEIRGGDKKNEKTGKKCSEGEHEEARHGAVLQAQQKQSQLLLEALARVCEVSMKNPKKLTRTQKEIVSSHGLIVKNWALVEETEFYLKIVNKDSGKTRMVDKFKRRK